MRYSEEWLNKINSQTPYTPRYTWNEIIKYYNFDNEGERQYQNLVILSEGVWMEISKFFTNAKEYDFIKIRAVTKNNVIFDGADRDGTISMGSIDHIFRIDGNQVDLQKLPDSSKKTKQEILLDFIKEYSDAHDDRLPKVPKGILKI